MKPFASLVTQVYKSNSLSSYSSFDLFSIIAFLTCSGNVSKLTTSLIIIFLSLHIIGIINLKFLNYEKRIETKKNNNFYSPILIGMAFAFGWTPCKVLF